MRKCRTISIFRKKIHTACILETRRAYRSTPGAPGARSKHYLLHLRFSGARKCKTVSIFRKKKSIRLVFWTHDERIARLLELPMHDLHTIYSIFADPGSSPKKTKKSVILSEIWIFGGAKVYNYQHFAKKKIHTACILEKRKAYRSTPGAPDVRSKHYLRHLTRCWGRLKTTLK